MRVFNLSPGPAIIPEAVLRDIEGSIVSYQNTGCGILEISHRGPAFEAILEETETTLRELLSISESYAVLFLQGGATLQFSMIPMNLAGPDATADYIISGVWAEKAAEEAAKFTSVHIAGTSAATKFSTLPNTIQCSKNPAYVHFTSNNTIYGTQYKAEPTVGDNLLVCDASSDILSRPIDIEKYGLIYAGAQKNLGTAGVTVVIIRKDLLSRCRDSLPLMLNYQTYAKNNSLYNTPPTFSIYVLCEYLRWVKKETLAAITARNEAKAALLYDTIDSHPDFFIAVAEKSARSLMNVTFRLPTPELEKQFVSEANDAGFLYLAGHRLVGGIRASIYNGFPLEGCEALAEFMKQFMQQIRK